MNFRNFCEFSFQPQCGSGETVMLTMDLFRYHNYGKHIWIVLLSHMKRPSIAVLDEFHIDLSSSLMW